MWWNDIELLSFWKKRVSWWFIDRNKKNISVLVDSGENQVLFRLSQKIAYQIVVVVLAGMSSWATVAQNSPNWCFPRFVLFVLFFPRGGSVCLSWRLEPSVYWKIQHILLFVLTCLICGVICWYCNTKKKKKDVCFCIYHHQACCLYQLLFSFHSIGGFILSYLTCWFCFFLTAFWK